MALTNAGLTDAIKALGAESITAFDNTNAAIAIGTGSTAASTSDTALGTETGRKGMEATYPQRSGLVVTYRSLYGTGDGNNASAVQEWGVLNNTTSGGTLLSRKVENLGVKSSAQSWTVTATLTWSVGT